MTDGRMTYAALRTLAASTGLLALLAGGCSASTAESPGDGAPAAVDASTPSSSQPPPRSDAGGGAAVEADAATVDTGATPITSPVDASGPDAVDATIADSGRGLDASVADASRIADATAAHDSAAPVAIDGGPNCVIPATPSFQKDVQPFLITSCSGTGCHVVDAASTMASGGFDHAYDWITAGAHASSCPETPTPLRFQVVIAVIDQADPPSCSKSRIMPPPGSTAAPLTPCQVATLQAWLDEPLVTQMHRADDSSPTTPYPMPPFN